GVVSVLECIPDVVGLGKHVVLFSLILGTDGPGIHQLARHPWPPRGFSICLVNATNALPIFVLEGDGMNGTQNLGGLVETDTDRTGFTLFGFYYNDPVLCCGTIQGGCVGSFQNVQGGNIIRVDI